MKNRKLGLILLLVLVTVGPSCFALTGGPDPFGYIWKDSAEPDVSFDWVDITGRPGAVQVTGLADDNAVGPFGMGWNFHYYWSDYNSVRIGSNGWISFNNIGNIASCFPKIPTPGGVGDNIIAPFMSDLSFVSNLPSAPNVGRMWYWTNNVDSFVIQWVNVPWWKNGSPNWVGSNTFELILSGTDSSVTFQYLQTDGTQFPGGSGCPTFMEIGIENVTGNLGLAFSSGNSVPPSNYTVKYFYPRGANFLVPDATPLWNGNSENGGQFVFPWTTFLLPANIGNVGNTPITNMITVNASLRDLQSVQLWSGSSGINGLNDGDNVTVLFPDTVQINTPGQYYFEVNISTAGNQDINPTNNSNTVEVTVVGNIGGHMLLTYSSFVPPSDGISWAGGATNDGIGVKMVPPAFPALIDTVSVFITGDGNSQTPLPSGFTIAIYGLDASGNPDPGALLHSQTVTASSVLEDGWNSVAISPPVSIGSRGFAVAWFQGGPGIGIGSEQYGPISRRTYEILGGAWAPYRNNTITEAMVRVWADMPVGVQDISPSSNALHCFPNPASDLINVRYVIAKPGDCRFWICDLTGRPMWEKVHSGVRAGEHLFQVGVDQLPAGLYLLGMEQRGEVAHRIVKIR